MKSLWGVNSSLAWSYFIISNFALFAITFEKSVDPVCCGKKQQYEDGVKLVIKNVFQYQ